MTSLFPLYGLQQKDSCADWGSFCCPNGQVDLHQSPDHMEDNIRPEVDSYRGDQSVLHITFARDESD